MDTGQKNSRSILANGNGCCGEIGELDTTYYSRVLDDLQGEISSKFEPKKAASVCLAAVYGEMGFSGRAQRVASCGTYLEYLVSDSEKHLHLANFCHDRLCPLCNWRRSLKIFGQVSQVMDVLEPRGLRFLFLTLTVRSCTAEELPATVEMLFSGWRYLYHKSPVFRRSVLGSFRSLEVTRNKRTGLFHPHLHVILAVAPDYFSGKNYVSQAAWCSLWRSACDLAYNPVIDVRTIKEGVSGLSGAVAEVSKYAVKSTDFLDGSIEDSVAFVGAFLSALSGRRLCSFTGCFAEVRDLLSLDDAETGDLVHVDGSDLRKDVAYLIVRYAWRAGYYFRVS